jgi:predicted SprT family Zn-dependent metalloprotease
MRTQKEKDAISMLRKSLKEYKLNEWKPALTGRGKKFAARTVYTKKTIEFSTKWLAVPATTEKEIKETILHEIAHALTPGAGHGQLWKDTYKRIGGTGKNNLANKVSVQCFSCGKVTKSAKRIRVCPKCKASFHR